jgi:hypothetical protein
MTRCVAIADRLKIRIEKDSEQRRLATFGSQNFIIPRAGRLAGLHHFSFVPAPV